MPVRQWVLSFPIPLRMLFAAHPGLLTPVLCITLAGLLALTASGVEGLELNVLGLTFGLNPFDPAIKLPLIGRIGAERSVVP